MITRDPTPQGDPRSRADAGDPGLVARYLFEWSEKLVGVDSAVCFVISGHELVPRFVFELPADSTAGVRLPLDGDGVIQGILRRGATQLLDGSTELWPGARLPWLRAVAVPLAIEGAAIGVYIAGWDAPYEIGRETLLVLEGAGAMAASAIHRAELLYTVKREEQRLRSLLDRLPLPAIGFSTPGLLVEHMNAEARRLIGDAHGRPLRQVLSGTHESSVAESPVGGDLLSHPLPDRIQLTTTGGSVRTVTPHMASLGSSGGVIMLVDVTSEANLESQRRRFVRMVSHHLRTPLTPLSGYSEVLASAENTDPLVRQAAADIVAAVNDITAHVQRLEQIAELQPARDDELEHPAVGDVIAEAWKRAHGRDGDLSITGDLRLAILCKSDHISGALAEIFINAYAHGRPPVEVTITTRGTDAVVTIHDGGAGIPAESASAVFAPYLGAESGYLAPAAGRLGLGLTLARGLVEASHGHLDYAEDRFLISIRTAPTP